MTTTRRTRARTSRRRRGSTAATHVPFVVAVVEATPSHDRRAREVISKLGYELVAASSEEGLLDRIRGAHKPDVVIVGTRSPDALITACRALGTESPVVVLAMSGPAGTARDRLLASGADLFVLRPHSKDSMTAILSAATALSGERRRAHASRVSEEQLRERLLRYGEADAATGFQHFDFFKRLLLIELKRAKRYKYPLAACLVALDPAGEPEQEPPPAALRRLRTQVASAIASCIRDIDIPVDFAEDRFLVFLPYTDLTGAERVGKRIARAAADRCEVSEGDQRYAMTVSIGIASLPEGTVSFAKLMRDARAALRAAQLKGGSRVVVRRR